MAYIRVRNNYIYICEKIKDKNGKWKEKTVKSCGRYLNETELQYWSQFEKLVVGKNIELSEYEALKIRLVEDYSNAANNIEKETIAVTDIKELRVLTVGEDQTIGVVKYGGFIELLTTEELGKS